MTYDSSVFSRGNYYKDSFYFKNTKGFRHIFTVNIPLHSKKTFHAASERTTRAAYSLASTQIKASAEASVRNRPPGAPSARQKKFRPGNPGRAKFQGWLADCIGRGHKSTLFLTLQNYPAAISSLRQSRYNPGNMALHARCSSRQSRSATPPGHKSSLPGL